MENKVDNEKEKLRQKLKEDCGRLKIGSNNAGCENSCCGIKIKLK
ncbi:hypothetical protein [Halanaerobium polyolivorans]|nr:hypothetical protein [Halanaerobium polyolivorans]